MLKIVAFFDYVDREDDFYDLDTLIIENARIDLKKKIKCVNAEDELSFERELVPGCIAVVDYGALNFNGHLELKDQYDRFMLSMIESHTSVDFIFVLTMGREYYKDDLFEHTNVHTIDRCAGLDDWRDLIKELRF